VAGTAVSLLLLFLTTRLFGIPRSAHIIYCILLIILLSDIPKLVLSKVIDIIMLAVPSAKPSQFRQILADFDQARVPQSPSQTSSRLRFVLIVSHRDRYFTIGRG
jgi:hypothetical protein